MWTIPNGDYCSRLCRHKGSQAGLVKSESIFYKNGSFWFKTKTQCTKRAFKSQQKSVEMLGLTPGVCWC